MLDESLRRRLEALNREPLRARDAETQQSALPTVESAGWVGRLVKWRGVRGWGRRTSLPGGTGGVPIAGPAVPMAVRPLGNLMERGEILETSAGPHLRIAQEVEAIWQDSEERLLARHTILKETCASKGHGCGRLSPEEAEGDDPYRRDAQALVQSFPDRTVFLDLETCGLAGAALFLVGLLRRIDGRLTVELLLARTYAEEKAVLVSLWERIVGHDVLVTFNGKSFDWPIVLDRSTRYHLGRAGYAGRDRRSIAPAQDRASGNGRSLPAGTAGHSPTGIAGPTSAGTLDPKVHIDVLHHARRRWRGRLPNCKLQTLERYICGRRRQGDIPGAEIPAAYQRFVETGDPCQMESILFHNALDLVTLLDLSLRLADQ